MVLEIHLQSVLRNNSYGRNLGNHWESNLHLLPRIERTIWYVQIYIKVWLVHNIGSSSNVIITARKRSLRRLCFYRCLSVHRGGVPSGGFSIPGGSPSCGGFSIRGVSIRGGSPSGGVLHPGVGGGSPSGGVLHPGGWGVLHQGGFSIRGGGSPSRGGSPFRGFSIQSMCGRYASYYNAFLSLQKIYGKRTFKICKWPIGSFVSHLVRSLYCVFVFIVLYSHCALFPLCFIPFIFLSEFFTERIKFTFQVLMKINLCWKSIIGQCKLIEEAPNHGYFSLFY